IDQAIELELDQSPIGFSGLRPGPRAWLGKLWTILELKLSERHVASFRCKAAGANHLQFRVEVTLHKWQMLETAFALRPVLFRALDAPTSGAWLCSWSIHHRHDAGDAAQSDLRDFCNRSQRVISNREPTPPPAASSGATTISRDCV